MSNCATVESSVGVAELSTLAGAGSGHVSWLLLSTKECGDVLELGDVPEPVEDPPVVEWLSEPELPFWEVGLEPDVGWFPPVAVAELGVLVLSPPAWSPP